MAAQGYMQRRNPLRSLFSRVPTFAGLADGTVRVGLSINVREAQYGAVGDGVTNDGPAILRALNAAAAAGLPLVVPPGVYNITSWTAPTYSTKVIIRGAGKFLSRIVGPAAKTIFFSLNGGASFSAKEVGFESWTIVAKLNSNVGGDPFDLLEMDDCYTTNIDISAISDVSTPADGGIRELRFTRNTCIDNGQVNTINSAALRLDSCLIYSAFVDGNEIRGVGGNYSGQKLGILLGAITIDPQTTMVVSNNRIYNVKNNSTAHCSGITVFGRNTRICNNSVNTVQSTSASNVDNYAIYNKSSYSTITGNTCVDAGGNAAVIMTKGDPNGDTGLPDSSLNNDNVIANNTILITSRWNITAYVGISIYNSGMDVHDNVIQGASLGIVLIAPVWAAVSRTMIHHNKLHALYHTAAANCYGMQLDSAHNAIVESNEINQIGTGVEATAYGINVIHATAGTYSGLTIRGNTIRSTSASTASQSRAIVVTFSASATVSGMLLEGNVVSDSQRGIQMSFAGTVSDVQIIRNIFRACATSVIAWSGTPPTDGQMEGNILDGAAFRTTGASDATPTVAALNRLRTIDTTAITQFDDGYGNQRLLVEVFAGKTITHNANIVLAGATNWTPASGGAIEFVRNAGVWREISRCAY